LKIEKNGKEWGEGMDEYEELFRLESRDKRVKK
jgi:hypothetical protein